MNMLPDPAALQLPEALEDHQDLRLTGRAEP